MAWIDDIDILNDAATANSDFSITSGFDSPTDNNSSATTPIYVEGSACGWMPLKKGVTDGYNATSTISGTPTMSGNRICVGMLNYPLADIANIPISAMYLRLSSSTGFTSNYYQWDARAQILSPENIPISGHTFIMGHEDSGTESGTFSGSCEAVGWVATTGSSADGKQGGFDWLFVISWVGAHSATLNGTYFSGLYSEYYDNEGSGLPGQTSRPIGVLSRAGNFYQSNISFQMGDGTSDTANLVPTETGKTIFFNNLHVNHELGYVFVDPASTHEVRLTLTDCVHFWNDQSSTAEIFTDPENATYFKLDGCSFSNGGIFESPPDTVNRWIRACKFDSCQTGVISDGDFTDNIVSNCYAVTVTGDADLAGSSFLTPAVAADGAGLIWTGNYDPNGNLDNMSFSKGTNDHHAIEFGISTPTTMEITGIDFSGFTNTVAHNAAPLHIKRTSGSVTVTLTSCTGITADGYKTAGATVTLVTGAVTVKATITDTSGTKIQSARVFIKASDGAGPFPFEDTVTIVNSGTTATVTHTAHGMASNDYVFIYGGTIPANEGVFQITYISASSYSYTMGSTPGASPTGTIESTFVALTGLTDVNGEIQTTRVYASNQNVSGWARKSSASPYYQQGPMSGTVDSSNGVNLSGVLALDE